MRLSRRRLARALEILLKGGQIKRINEFEYKVRAQSRSNEWYTVKWMNGKWTCSCEDYTKRRRECKHIYAILLLQKLPEIIMYNVASLEVRCPKCGSVDIIRKGVRDTRSGLIQKYMCKSCGAYFSDREGFNGLRHNPIAVIVSLDLYYKKVSLRDISHHLRQVYGIEVSHSTVHRWIARYIRLLRRVEEKLRPKLGDTWQMDDMIVKFRGEPGYVWNILDMETRYLVAMTISDGRGTEEALKAIKEGLKKSGDNKVTLRTDALKSYEKAAKKLRGKIKHQSRVRLSSPENNNMVERFNGTLRDWLKSKRLIGRISENTTIDGFRIYYNLIRPHRSLKENPPIRALKDGQKLNWLNLIQYSFLFNENV